MKKIIKDFPAYHKKGDFLCEISSFRDILHYYGYDLTLEMCFGISSAMGFGYGAGHLTRPLSPDYFLPFYIATGFAPFPLRNACRLTNVWSQSGRTRNSNGAWDTVKKYINDGRPVVVEVEMMKYIPLLGIPALNSKNPGIDWINFQIGGHVIIIIGYDEQEGTVLIIETMLKDPVKIPLDKLRECREVFDGFVPPENEWSVYYVPPKLPPLSSMIINSIQRTIHQMKYPYKFSPHHHFGLDGLKKFKDEIFKWPDLMDTFQLQRSLYMVYNSSDRICKDGGFLRKLFAKFLDESSAIIKNEKLKQAAAKYWELRDLWVLVSRLIVESINAPDKGLFDKNISAKILIEEIYQKEIQAIEYLEEII